MARQAAPRRAVQVVHRTMRNANILEIDHAQRFRGDEALRRRGYC